MAKMLLTPVVSEKSLALTEAEGNYVFIVPRGASKITVAKEITERFKVNVSSVNTVNMSGKAKSAVVRRGRRQVPGKRSDFKKAYVRLAKGESIKLFEEPKQAGSKKGQK